VPLEEEDDDEEDEKMDAWTSSRGRSMKNANAGVSSLIVYPTIAL
jgi:hypothetical protein